MPLDEYDAGERRFVRAHLPGADPDRDIVVTLRGDELGLRWQHRFDGLDCGSGATHCVTFEKHFRVPAGLTPDDFEAEHGDGVLLVSWPAVPSSATARLRGEPVERRVVVDLTGSPK
jgi:HSP20 family molecular chaperone IbpA